MVVLQGLLALIAAVAAVATSSDSTQSLSDNFVISSQHFNGLFTGQQVFCAASPCASSTCCGPGTRPRLRQLS